MRGFKILVEQMIAVSGGLGIPREEMPQIPSAKLPEFFSALSEWGVPYSDQTIAATALKPTQTHVDSEKIGPERASYSKPLLVSRDHYILDGHHGWASNPEGVLNCIVIDLPIETLLSYAWEFEASEVAA